MAKELNHANEAFDSDVNEQNIKEVDLSKTMKSSFLDYSMSVIVSRAIPEVRDGFKPVHRRIVYAMNDLGMTYSSPHKKSARIVGEVMGKYHPHGDAAIYDAMCRLAQDFNMRYCLVDGHGNFGNQDGDEPAASRYTEARLSKIAQELVRDINKNTVDFVPNYDGEDKEPIILPCRIPNILINGTTGIAVGMTTNIPPHNLSETIDAALAVVNNPDITVNELMEIIKGPDFPTGGIILGRSGIRQAYETGTGSLVIRSRCEIEDDPNHKERKIIVVKEIPYGIRRRDICERIGTLMEDKTIDGISDVRDESNMNGVRIVVEVKKDAIPEVILNKLLKFTQLQSGYSINMLAIYDGQPKVFSLKEILTHYMEHQIEVVRRRVKFDLDKAEEKIHILNGLMIAVSNIDEVIKIIKESRDTDIAMQKLEERFGLDEIQSKAIVDMKLGRITGMEITKLADEIHGLEVAIADFKDILNNHSRVVEVIKQDMEEIKAKYGDERKTQISNESATLDDEDLIPQEDVVITLTKNGYIKRVPVDTYKTQHRGGVGIKGITTHDDDDVDKILTTTTHCDILLFSARGKVFRLRGYTIPEFARTGKGTPIINLLEGLDKEDKIKTLISVPDYPNPDEYQTKSLFFVSKNGICKRTALNEFERINKNGKIALGIKEDDELFDVKLVEQEEEIYIASNNGKVCRFNIDGVRHMGRTACGVKGIELTNDAKVIGLCLGSEGKYILVVSTLGLGKMSDREDYRLTNRGSKGVITLNVTDKTGDVASVLSVNGDEDLLVTTSRGVMIRTWLGQVKIAGRNTQGVKIIKLDGKQTVATITTTEHIEEVVEETEKSTEEPVEK